MCFATTACTFSRSELPKVVQTPSVFNILTSKCASRHNGVHCFDIATSKSRPTLRCFVHFDLEMCFAPQRRALFQHLNFQKWSENGVFCTFWLRNVLRATTACTFSTSQLPKWSDHGVFCTFSLGNVLRATTACNFSSLVWLRTRRFSEPTFRPSEATNHWKNAVFRDFPTFSRICIFFLLTLSLLLFFLLIFLFSLPLPCSAFHLSILSEVWLLNFLWLKKYIYIYSMELPLMANLSQQQATLKNGDHEKWDNPPPRWPPRGLFLRSGIHPQQSLPNFSGFTYRCVVDICIMYIYIYNMIHIYIYTLYTYVIYIYIRIQMYFPIPRFAALVSTPPLVVVFAEVPATMLPDSAALLLFRALTAENRWDIFHGETIDGDSKSLH